MYAKCSNHIVILSRFASVAFSMACCSTDFRTETTSKAIQKFEVSLSRYRCQCHSS